MSAPRPRAAGAATGPVAELLVPASLATALVDEARRALPRESCGVLLGRGPDENGRLRLTRTLNLPNTAPMSVSGRFTAAPEPLRSLLESSRSELVGYYHSHVTGAPTPSGDDLKGGWPGLVAVLVGPTIARAPRLEAFLIEPAGAKMLWRRLRLRTLAEGR